jgi:predicted ferric reductase
MTHTWWYVARSGGIVAWTMLAFATFWGIALAGRLLGPKPRPNWMQDLHRFAAGLAVVFTGVHVLGLVADSYVHFGPTQVLVPFTGDYHPTAVGLGIIGMYLLLAVELSSLARKHLSKRVWKGIHMLSFPLFAFSTAHLLMVGTDRTNLLVRMTVVALTLVVAVLGAARFLQPVEPAPQRVPVRR